MKMKKTLFAVLAVLVAGYSYAANYWELRDKTNVQRVTINDAYNIQGVGGTLIYQGSGASLTGVVASDVADGSITSTKLANNAVVEAKIENGAVTTNKLGDGAVTDGKVVTISASKLTGALPAIDGSALTGIVASDVADGSITSTKLAAGAVATSSKLGDGAVTTDKLGNGAVTNDKVATGIDAAKLATGPIRLSNGSQGAPAYSFSGDTDSGMYSFGLGEMKFSVNNTVAMHLQEGVQDYVTVGSGFYLKLGDGPGSITFVGGKTTAELQALACSNCIALNSNDFDLYTSTGALAGQWRNARTGVGPQ
jgi:hypothetical protein